MARLVAALALGATAASALTQDEAQCIAKFNGGQTFVWVGDSNMRYESLAFNEYLEQGTILSAPTASTTRSPTSSGRCPGSARR